MMLCEMGYQLQPEEVLVLECAGNKRIYANPHH